MKKTDDPIVVSQHFPVSKDELWQAITQPEAMVKWFFEQIKSFKPKEGFETRFTVLNEGRTFPHLWKITEVKPVESITYNWKYEGYAGDSLVTFNLHEKPEGCELVVTHRVTEDFPDGVPELSREACIGGWKWFIQKSLRDYIKKETPD